MPLLFAVFLVPQAVVLTHAALSSPFTLGAADGIAAASFAAEGAAAAFVVFLLLQYGRRWGKALSAVLAILYIGAVAVQFITFHYTLGFLPRIALENTDNIRLFLTVFTFATLAAAAVYALAAADWVLRSSPCLPKRLRMLALAVPISLAAIFPSGLTLEAAKNVPPHPPVTSMVRMLLDLPSGPDADALLLTMIDTESIKPRLSDSEYPLVKDSLYSTAPIAPTTGETPPEVIIIFMEGISTRFVGAYDDTFPDLMPQLSAFAEDPDSLVVRDYFNHTAATFDGLLGQLCSIYPARIPHADWRGAYEGSFRCLPHIFSDAGYRTTFLDPHFADADHLHAMLERLGFDEVLTAEDILALHLEGKDPGDDVVRVAAHFTEATVALTTRDTFAALAHAVAERSDGPRLIATYPFGTHAWVDTPEDGIKYGDGANNSLNTAADLDAWFGAFWRAFRASDAYPNTVVIVTTDHAKYHETSYVQALAERGATDYQRLFADRIPLIVHDPRGVFTRSFDARNATSIDLAPTVAHYLGLPNGQNPFLGASLFERQGDVGLVNYGSTVHVASQSMLVDVTAHDDNRLRELREALSAVHRVMEEGRVWPE